MIRGKDIAKEKEKKEEALYRLTTREREIRKRIEDIVEPYNRSRCLDPGATPLKSSKLVNGNAKGKTNGDSKKGKKRKNPS
jgi:COMPASS component SPP1